MKRYDVAVVGCGVAGVAAAAAAARMGAKTVIIEKTCTPGGLATAGLINIFLPLCDGNGTQVTFGLADELIRLSLKYGPGKIPPDWMHRKNAAEEERLRCVFSPAAMILALEELLMDNQVDIWYDTLVTGVEKSGKQIQSVTVENTDGRSVIEAKSFVDASGSALLARLAGENVTYGKNVLSLWALEYEGSKQYGRDRMVPEINMLTRGNPNRTFTGPDAKDISSYMMETRSILRQFYQDEQQAGRSDRFQRWPLMLASMPQFRKIAARKGDFELSDNMNNRYFADSIGLVSDWRKSGPVWEIPFGTITAPATENLFAAGRCISSVGDAWEITRCIPCACLTGEAAGYAAAFRCGDSGDLTEQVQKQMVKGGNILHWRQA